MKRDDTPLTLDQRIANPCVQICVRDRDDGVCLGCGRTSDEINDWINLSRAQRAAIVDLLDDRVRSVTAKRRARRSGRPSRERNNAV